MKDVRLTESIIPTVPYRTRAVGLGAKVPLHHRVLYSSPRMNVAYTGRGFLPDYMSEHGYTTMVEASRSNSEVEGVLGVEGMMPPPGARIPALQSGQALDTGSGGAGSFSAGNTFNGKG